MSNNCENCIEGRPRIGRLAGVTRTMRLALYEGEGVPEGTPQDLTGLTVVVRVLKDGTNDIYTPEFVIEGTDSNVIKFTWPADRQAVGNYTIDVTLTDGSNNVNRVNWHGKDGIRLVEYSNQVYGDDATGAESSEAVGLVGYFTTNGVGMSAFDEWRGSDESTGYPQTVAGFMAYLQQPATDAAAAAEATMTSIQSRADDDHTRAGNDHSTAESDHTRAGNDHTLAASDHTTAASDHTRSGSDHDIAVADHAQAEADHTRAEADHTTAAADHTLAASDHTLAAADHAQAGTDHGTAAADHTLAASDHTTAASDHTQAGTDHTTAAADHTLAASDHTTAAADHVTAGIDHSTAAADHTQAVADHAVMSGYDTRLTNVEGEVTQLGQKTKGANYTELSLSETTGSYIKGNNGSIGQAANTAYTEKFYVEAGKKITVIGRGYDTNFAMIAKVVTDNEQYTVLVRSTDSTLRTYEFIVEESGYYASSYYTTYDHSVAVSENTPELIVNKLNPLIGEVGDIKVRTNDQAPSSGKYGYKLLVGNINLTQEIVTSWANNIVEVRGKLVVPASTQIEFPDAPIVLYFNGGSIDFTSANSYFYPKGAKVVAGPYQIFFGDIPLFADNASKYFTADTAYPEWAGAKGDGASDDSDAFNFIANNIYANQVKLVPGRTYTLESGISLKSNLVGDKTATIQRSRKWIDIPLTSTPSVSGRYVSFTVDSEAETFSDMKVGMGVLLVDKEGGITSFSTRDYFRISEISGSTVTLKKIAAGNASISYSGNTPSEVALVNLFTLVSISGKVKVDSVKFDLGRTIIDDTRMKAWQPCVGISITSANSSIINCDIANSIGDAVVVFGKDCLLEHNLISHCGSNAVHLSGCYGAVIEGNHFFDTNIISTILHNEGGITFSNEIYQTLIHGNKFDTGRNGIGSLDSAGNCKVTISDNLFIYFRENGVQGACWTSTYGNVFRDYVITGNRFYGSLSAVIANETGYEGTPVVDRIDSTGYGVLFAHSSGAYWMGILVADNHFYDCGVSLGNCASGSINSNEFIGRNKFAGTHPANLINLRSSYINVDGNLIDVIKSATQVIKNEVGRKINVSNNVYRPLSVFADNSALINLSNNIPVVPTIIFNQLADVPYGTSETYGNLTITKNEDGKTFTFNGTTAYDRSGIFSLPFDFKGGHQYYLRTGNAAIDIYETYDWAHSPNLFVLPTENASNKRVQFWATPGTYDNEVAAMQVFDLTAMFGSTEAAKAAFGVTNFTSETNKATVVAKMAEVYPELYYAQNLGTTETLNTSF